MAGKDLQGKEEYERFLWVWREADVEVPVLRQVRAEYGQRFSRRTP
ncbi:MAG TPA: hypothetical protein VFB14_00245 [Bryobacteraceae bacterium]|nr:hypothetical protein [Bryobacteraceae bacterium]